MGFSDRFEIIEPLVTSEAQTFAARERTTGKRVLIHFLPRAKRPNDECSLAPVLLSHPGSGDPVIEVGECDDPARLYAVTEMQSDAVMNQGWLNARTTLPPSQAVTSAIDTGALRRAQTLAAEPAPEPIVPFVPETPEHVRPAFSGQFAGPLGSPADSSKVGGQTGDFTRMWDASSVRDQVHAEETRVQQPAVEPAPEPPSDASEPGEFTRIIQGSPLSAGAASAAPAPDFSTPPTPSSESPVRDNEPGEFTRMFSSSPLTESPKPGGSSGSGSFTRLFNVQPGAVTSFDVAKSSHTDLFRPSASAENESPLPPVSSKDPSGSFSMMMKAPTEHAPDKPSNSNDDALGPDPFPQTSSEPAHAVGSGSAATQLFIMPKDREQKNAPPPEDLGPSEFTRVISSAQVRDAEARASASSAPMSSSPVPPVQMGAAAPVLNMPQVTAPSITPPSVTPPSVTPPSLTPPSMSAGSFTPPSMQAPSMSAPSFSAPSMSAPSISAPSFSTPSLTPPVQTSAPATVPKQFLYMVLSINVLFLIAVALIVYFMVKR